VCDELFQQLIVGCCEKRFVTQFWVFVQYLKQELEVDGIKLAEVGPKFEHHEMFPARTNTG
jgi:hypothetical protein